LFHCYTQSLFGFQGDLDDLDFKRPYKLFFLILMQWFSYDCLKIYLVVILQLIGITTSICSFFKRIWSLMALCCPNFVASVVSFTSNSLAWGYCFSNLKYYYRQSLWDSDNFHATSSLSSLTHYSYQSNLDPPLSNSLNWDQDFYLKDRKQSLIHYSRMDPGYWRRLDFDWWLSVMTLRMML